MRVCSGRRLVCFASVKETKPVRLPMRFENITPDIPSWTSYLLHWTNHKPKGQRIIGMSALSVSPEKTSTIDYSLLLSRLEREIIQGSDPQRCKRIIHQQQMWEKLEPDLQLHWAHLAQMAGEVEVTLAIYANLNQSKPDMVLGWVEHIELLSILDRRKEAASIVAASRINLTAEQYQQCLKLCKGVSAERKDIDISAASAPFEAMRTRQEAIACYMELFSGREDCFARQWVEKSEQKQGYVPVKHSMEPKDIEDHVSGRLTYGIYLLKSDSMIKTAVIDVDLVQKYRQAKLKSEDVQRVRRERDYMIKRILEISEAAGMMPVVEFSGGKGYHFWYCFASPVQAALARRALEKIRKAVSGDLTVFNLEVFPKQDQLSGKGFGNLVKLPLGIHRVTGKQSWFIDCHDRSMESQLAYVSRINPIPVEALDSLQSLTQPDSVILHPRFRQWAESYPELYTLEQCCPPLAQIMASCRNRSSLSIREEKVIYQTLGFLPRKKTLTHLLMADQPEYNPHLTDYKLSRVRGTPLGCTRIHSLLGFTGDICRFNTPGAYAHPLLHLGENKFQVEPKSEKTENLQGALENLKLSILVVQSFI
ncbi:MAG: CRISPR-associated primase-polymerase type A1 [Deltaproteobacteria bacterium]